MRPGLAGLRQMRFLAPVSEHRHPVLADMGEDKLVGRLDVHRQHTDSRLVCTHFHLQRDIPGICFGVAWWLRPQLHSRDNCGTYNNIKYYCRFY